MLREDSVRKHLRDGLEGKNLKDTFLLYLSSVFLLLIFGLIARHYWGIERLLKVTPILVGAVIFFEYIIGWLPGSALFANVRAYFVSVGRGALSIPSFLSPYREREVMASWIRQPSRREKDVLTINLSSPQLSESREKLHHIYLLYNECHYLLDSSHQSRDVKVASIETTKGHVVAKLFGEQLVISLVTFLIEATVTYLYINYAREGKQADISFTALERVVNLEAKLREAGTNTNEMRDQIRKSSIRISHQLNELLANESVVKVNEKVFPINKEESPNLSDQRSMIVLGTKSSKRKSRNVVPA